MICEKDLDQLQMFTTPFEQTLDLENRWVKFAKIIPWGKINSYYYLRMSKRNGAATKDARIVLGALINELPRGRAPRYPIFV